MVNDTDDGAELARWLEDSGRRRAVRLDEAPEKLLEHLESRAGRKLRSRDEIDAFIGHIEREREEIRRAAERRRIGRELTLVALLAAAVAQYYFVDIAVQISRLHSNYYFVAATR